MQKYSAIRNIVSKQFVRQYPLRMYSTQKESINSNPEKQQTVPRFKEKKTSVWEQAASSIFSFLSHYSLVTS
jgi:hypothetical protein